MLTLSVRGLPRQSTEQSITELFTQFGRIRGLKMAKDLFSGECKGFAELDMEGHEARAAIAALNGSGQLGGMLQVGFKRELRQRRR